MARAKTTPAGERLATLEATLGAHMEADGLAFGEIKAQMTATHALVEKLAKDVNKRNSFIAGIVFAVSALWAVVIGIASFWPFK